MKEIWKDIPDTDGIYQASTLGNIRSLKDRGVVRTKVLAQSTRGDGYKSVCVKINGKLVTKLVHRLVAITFLPNPDNLEMINHKDEDRSNNCIDNLEWCSRSYNQIYSINIHPERRTVFANNFLDEFGNSQSSYTKKGVPHSHFRRIIQLSLEGDKINEFDNASQASMQLGYLSENIIRACTWNESGVKPKRGRSKFTAYGYVWEFIS